jgi:hypothetical protein
MVSGDNMSNFSENNDDEYAMVFSLSRKPNQQTELSNIIAETYLKRGHILLMKKSLIKRSKISNEIIPFKEIVEINLNRSSKSSISSSVDIVYTKNGYSKRFISLSTSDIFAVRWFYSALLEKLEVFNKNQDLHEKESGFAGNDFYAAGNDSDLDKAHELEDFVNKMSKPVSKEDKRKIKVSERFDRCSSGEY